MKKSAQVLITTAFTLPALTPVGDRERAVLSGATKNTRYGACSHISRSLSFAYALVTGTPLRGSVSNEAERLRGLSHGIINNRFAQHILPVERYPYGEGESAEQENLICNTGCAGFDNPARAVLTYYFG